MAYILLKGHNAQPQATTLPHRSIHIFKILRLDSTSGKHVHEMYTPLNPLLYRKTGVCRGIPIFLISDPKHKIVGIH